MSMHCVVCAVTRQQAERLRQLDEEEQFFQDLEKAPRIDVAKEWHALHFLLTGTASEVYAPEGFLLDGGEALGPDGGNGPTRLFSPREVDDIHSALVDIGDEELWSRFDADRMNAHQVYPSLDWHEELELTRRIYLKTFRELKSFVDKASRHGQCLIVTLN